MTSAKEKAEAKRYRCTDKLQKILTVMNRYAQIGDIFVQQQPEYVATAWGVFRFVLEVSTYIYYLSGFLPWP